MSLQTDEILDVLRERGSEPQQQMVEVELPGIGQVEEGETIYSTSVEEVFREPEGESPNFPFALDDGRLNEWWREIEGIIGTGRPFPTSKTTPRREHCAWYCPIHFFGHAWGIYIRESCILSCAVEIARFVNWRAVPLASSRRYDIARQLLRSAFYVFFLHEQFHHKVESLGFRLLIANGADRYRPYKANVYRRSYGTPQCIEESLANAESYLRLSEDRHIKRLDKAIRNGLRDFLKASFPVQPSGYAEAVNYLDKQSYRDGLWELQSQVLDGRLPPTTPTRHWAVAPKVITALMNILENIYVILPLGARPIFKPTSIDPGATVSSRDLVGALTKHHGYQQVAGGGKGSHIKLD